MIDLPSLDTAHPGKVRALFGLSPAALAELLESVLPVLVNRRLRPRLLGPIADGPWGVGARGS